MNIGSGTFSIPPLKYIVPRSLYPILNVEDVPGVERTWIESSGPGEFNLGQKWLENVYTAYDSEYFGFSRSFFFSFHLFCTRTYLLTWIFLFSLVRNHRTFAHAFLISCKYNINWKLPHPLFLQVSALLIIKLIIFEISPPTTYNPWFFPT